jgi:hypothetical protein
LSAFDKYYFSSASAVSYSQKTWRKVAFELEKSASFELERLASFSMHTFTSAGTLNVGI